MAGLGETFRHFYETTRNGVAEAMDRDDGWTYGNLLPLRSRPDPSGDGRQMELAVPNAVREVVDAVSLPGRAMRGEPYTARDVTEMALEVGALGAPVPRPRGALGMFAGRNARTADLDALDVARRMEADGVDADRIWRETGWGRGADGDGRFEIDDSGAQVATLEDDPPVVGRVADAVRHGDLTTAYPEVANSRYSAVVPSREGRNVVAAWGGRPGDPDQPGQLYIALRADGARTNTLHELQHGVQAIEGFARGDTKAKARLVPGSPAYDIYLARRAEFGEPEVDGMVDRTLREVSLAEAYDRSAGEVEARNVERRVNMTPAERRATPPWATEKIPRDQQIVRRRRD
jgi:hypothetical protein